MAYAGLLKNLQPPPPKPNIRIQPYVLGSYDRYKNFPASTEPEKIASVLVEILNGPSIQTASLM
jgi:hypothetical protein